MRSASPSAREWLHQRKEHQDMNYSLERITRALEEAGNPQEALASIHVVGTNGKGSTAAMIAACLRCKEPTGLFTSPHLVTERERIRINDALISEEDLEDVLEEARALDARLSYFEALTVAAALHFTREGIRTVVWEAGLGGRLDATAAMAGRTVAVTSIGLDHQHVLGDTREAIVVDKLGIAPPGSTVLVTTDNEDLRDVIEETLGHPAHWCVPYEGTLAMHGAWQRLNAGLAAAVARHHGISIPDIEQALATVTWAGRLEQHGNVILDAAHNEHAWERLGKEVARWPERPVIVWATTRKRGLAGPTMIPHAEVIYTHVPGREMATPLDAFTGKGLREPDPREALKIARRRADTRPVLACGSLYLIGCLKEEP